MAQQVLQPGEGKLPQGPHMRGIALTEQLPVVSSKVIKQARRFGKMARRLSQRGLRRWEALAYRSQHLMAQKVSSQRGVGIALVGYPGQAFSRCVAFNFCTGNVK